MLNRCYISSILMLKNGSNHPPLSIMEAKPFAFFTKPILQYLPRHAPWILKEGNGAKEEGDVGAERPQFPLLLSFFHDVSDDPYQNHTCHI